MLLVVLLLRQGPAKHAIKGRVGEVVALTVPVTERGATRVAGVVSVFHRKAARPLDPAGLFSRPGSLPGRGPVSGAHEAQPQDGGDGGGQQAPLAVVY